MRRYTHVVPVPEPKAVVFGVPAEHGDEGEDDEADDEDDLAGCEVEFGLGEEEGESVYGEMSVWWMSYAPRHTSAPRRRSGRRTRPGRRRPRWLPTCRVTCKFVSTIAEGVGK